MSDNDSFVLHEEGVAGHYEQMLAAASPDFVFPDFDENSTPLASCRSNIGRPHISQ